MSLFVSGLQTTMMMIIMMMIIAVSLLNE